MAYLSPLPILFTALAILAFVIPHNMQNNSPTRIDTTKQAVFSLTRPHNMQNNSPTRIDTTKQAVFSLTRPHPVTYEFESLYPDIRITVPQYSRWSSTEHFHDAPDSCAAVLIVSGNWVITSHNGGSISCHSGFKYAQKLLWYLKWYKDRLDQQSASLRLTAPTQLYRTICSVIQDAERYYGFRSTPVWLRSLFAGTYLVPIVGGRGREWMINVALWIQLRVIYEANDFWPYEGEVPLTRLFIWAPDWVEDWQDKSGYIISRLVVHSASRFGRWILGMRSSYVEYDVI